MADTRGKALSILRKVCDDKAYSNIAIDEVLKGSTMDKRDKAFVTNMVYGVLTNRSFLDYQISAYSKIPIKKLSSPVINILRLSIYQIHFMDRVPDSAAVNEGVTLAKRVAFKSAGFVNAVLRTLLKEGIRLPSETDTIYYLSILYSYPEWILRMWFDFFDRTELEALLAAGNNVPPLTIRVNTTKISTEELKERLGAIDGVCEGALNLVTRGSVAETEGFADGLFTVQDAAAQMASLALDIKAGERILDMCAAPGGKTTHIAELTGPNGAVVAWDKYPHKIILIEKTAERLGLTNISAYVHNGCDIDTNHINGFDKVLLDAPCSGLGIIRKKPDIKWSRSEEDILLLCEEQRKLLHAASLYVKPGGILVYSTCTISDRENERMIEDFLMSHHNYVVEGEATTMLPHINNTDGFFICTLRRQAV